MTWEIEYYSEKVERAILHLPTGILARYLHLTDMMEQLGPNLGMPHTKSLGEKLFELRMKSKEGTGRVFYCTRIGRRIVMLRTFVKKTQKTPHKELEIARKRLKEILSNET